MDIKKIKINYILLIILVLGFYLRFDGFARAEPLSYHPDDYLLTEKLVEFTGGQESGAGTKYLGWPGITALNFYGLIYNVLGSDLTYEKALHTLQLTSIILGTLSILVLYFIVKKIYSQRAALFASALFSVMMLHVRVSHWSTTDAALIFFMLYCFYFLAKIHLKTEEDELFSLKGGKLKIDKDYAFASLFFVLSVATKWSGLTLLAAIAIAVLLRYDIHNVIKEKRIKKSSLKGIINSGVFILLLSLAFSFIVWPQWITQIPEIQAALAQGSLLHKTGHYGIFPTAQLSLFDMEIYAYTVLKWTMGILAAIAGFLGLIFALIRHNKDDMLFAGYTIIYLLFIGMYPVRLERYYLLVFPFFAIFIAIAADYILTRTKTEAQKYGIYAVCAVIFLFTFGYTMAYNDILSEKDVRVEAGEWLDKNLQQGASITYAPGTQSHTLAVLKRNDYVFNSPKPDYILMTRPTYHILINYINHPEQYKESDFNRAKYITQEVLSFYDIVYNEKGQYKLVKTFSRTPSFAGFEIDETNAPYTMWSETHPEIRVYQRAEG